MDFCFIVTPIQVHMIQRLVPLLGLDHGALGLTEEQFNALKEVGTFTTTTAPSTVTDPSVHELLTASTDSAQSTVEESSTTETRTNSTDSTSTAEESNESVDSASSESSTISTSTSTTSTSTSEEIEENTQTTEVSESLSSSSEDPSAATSTDAATESTSTTDSSTEHPDNFREPKVVNESETESTIVPTTTTTSTVAESSESTTTEHSTENVAESSTAETAASTESTLAAETSPSSEVATSTVAVNAEVTTEDPSHVGLVMELHNELLNFTTFVQYEPEHEHFNTIPRLDSIAKHLSCDVLVASRSAASSVSANQLSQMETTELRNCLEVLGAIPWPRSDIGPVWRELKKKLGYHKSAMKPIKREEMIKLSNLLPAVVHEDVDLIDVRHEHIDGISIIGR